MIFAEAMTDLDEYRVFTNKVQAPILANITEFGKTPLFTRQELADAGVSLILYPLSAFRAMSKAALTTYETIIQQGTQRPIIDAMQSRNDLYQVLGYHKFEEKLDQLMEDGHEK